MLKYFKNNQTNMARGKTKQNGILVSIINWSKRNPALALAILTIIIAIIGVIISIIFGWLSLESSNKSNAMQAEQTILLNKSSLSITIIKPTKLNLDDNNYNNKVISLTVIQTGNRLADKVSFGIQLIENVNSSCHNNYLFNTTNQTITDLIIPYSDREYSDTVAPPCDKQEIKINISSMAKRFAESIRKYTLREIHCEVVQKIKVCPFYEDTWHVDQCSDTALFLIKFDRY
jgi:hypothetical protein